MRKNPFDSLDDQEVVRRLVRENPWGRSSRASSAGLVASHYPILLEEDREELSIVTHLGRPDEGVHELGQHELLVIIQGPHGYISSSWYGEHVEVPTWNFITAHLWASPILSPQENFEVLHRLVEHFEEPVAHPRPSRRHPRGRGQRPARPAGTIGLRLVPDRVVAKRKMSQNQEPADHRGGAGRARGRRSLRERGAGEGDAAGRGGAERAGLAAQDSCQGVRTRGPSAVTATVNSKWAAIESSCRVDGPAVVAHADLGAAGVDHRLDRQHHALLQLGALAGLAEVRDLRVLVHLAPDPVADQRADHREVVQLDPGLDRVRDVAEAVARAGHRDPVEQRRRASS